MCIAFKLIFELLLGGFNAAFTIFLLPFYLLALGPDPVPLVSIPEPAISVEWINFTQLICSNYNRGKGMSQPASFINYNFPAANCFIYEK